jgi:4-hydroxy-tetrahydrodipicolinate synthase
MSLSGSMVAVVTPMDADGAVNYTQFAKVIDFHIEGGTQALVVAGTTGESATLDQRAHGAIENLRDRRWAHRDRCGTGSTRADVEARVRSTRSRSS